MSGRPLFAEGAEATQIGRRRRGGGGDPGGDLDITPMIDVTFLLLIFFMVTSTMSSQQELDVPQARHGDKVDEGAAIMIVIHSPQTVGGTPQVELRQVPATLNDVAAFVREEASKGKTEVVVKAGREVPHGFVQQVFREATSVDGLSFSLGVEDKTGN
jgi:biopolymer transport protein ExbD